MPSNIEIKARTGRLDEVRAVAEKITDRPCRIIHQEDVFFRSPSGRLKLRIFPDNTGELIHYERPDTVEAKQSNYEIYQTSNPRQLRRILSDALAETVTVRKTRQVFFVGQTRIHLDAVEGLGTFVELEVVLDQDQPSEEGRKIATQLMEKLGIEAHDLVDCAYADML